MLRSILGLSYASHTNYEATSAEESMHRVQSPRNDFLKIGCYFPYNKIEEPVGGSRQRYALRTNGKGHDLSPLSNKRRKSRQSLTDLGRIKPRNWTPTRVAKSDERRPSELIIITDLYPNAALKMMTQITTALGVFGTSMYIQYPVATSAELICKDLF